MKYVIVAIAVIIFCAGCSGNSTPGKQSQTDGGDNLANTPPSQHFAVPLADGFMGRGGTGEYEVYMDSVNKHDGHNVPTIRSVTPLKFATVIGNMQPMKCIGKRIMYTAWVRAKDVKGWASLWLRIDPDDPAHKPALGFDNMSGRPIRGTGDWAQFQVVMDVPEGAADLVYGALLSGNGQVWIDSMDIKIVDSQTPRTDSLMPKFKKVL